MKVVFVPLVGNNIYMHNSYSGPVLAGLEVDVFDESQIVSYIKQSLPFLENESLDTSLMRLGPQGFHFHKNEKYFGVCILSDKSTSAKFQKYMIAQDAIETWGKSDGRVRPLLQAMIDPGLYDALYDDVRLYALDRLADSEGMTAKQISEEFGIKLKAAENGLIELCKEGLIQCWERAGKVYKITELGLQELAVKGWTPYNKSDSITHMKVNTSLEDKFTEYADAGQCLLPFANTPVPQYYTQIVAPVQTEATSSVAKIVPLAEIKAKDIKSKTYELDQLSPDEIATLKERIKYASVEAVFKNIVTDSEPALSNIKQKLTTVDGGDSFLLKVLQTIKSRESHNSQLNDSDKLVLKKFRANVARSEIAKSLNLKTDQVNYALRKARYLYNVSNTKQLKELDLNV